jgi:hypothetical protein
MKFFFSAVLLSSLLLAQSGKPVDRKNRTAPTGYSDTPVITGQQWKVHDIDRPRPAMVKPGLQPGAPPSDAVVLFDGKDMSAWQMNMKKETVAPTWKVENGYMEITHGSGSVFTKESFGDCQLHIEWMAPPEIEGTSQWRGNSGVLLMNRYEIQVLDSWENPTYADGQAGSIYGQWPPLVNATRKPGEWQTYDIIFEAPRWEGEKLVRSPYVTVIHNGIVLHHRKEIIGPMAHKIVAPMRPHRDEEPLGIQNHDTRVRYRNIWMRRLTAYDQMANQK